MTDKARLAEILRHDDWCTGVLRTARKAELSDYAIAGGFVRNAVWDHLHRHHQPNRPRDIDLAYFDPNHLDPNWNREIEARLNALRPDLLWEPSNQALHDRPDQDQPVSLEAALGLFPETVTAIGVRLEPDDALTVISPFGLGDLFDMKVRRNPASLTKEQFFDRVKKKRIRQTWPDAAIIDS